MYGINRLLPKQRLTVNTMFSLRKVAFTVSNVRNRSLGAILEARHVLDDNQHHNDIRFTNVEGVQGEEKSISVEESRQILEEAIEYSIHGPSIQGIQGGYDELADIEYASTDTNTVTEIPENIKNYSYSRSINLHGCMQTNVPDPYAVQSDRCVAQLDHGTPQNMPGNGKKLYQKYVSGGRNDINIPPQRRSFHVGVQNLAQTAQPSYNAARSVDDTNLKSDNYIQHEFRKSGFQNCDERRAHRFNHENCNKLSLYKHCKENLLGFHMGRKILANVFNQQDQIVYCIAVNHQQMRHYSTSKQNQPDPDHEEVGNNPPESSPNPQDSPSKYSRANLKKAIAEYGSTVIVFHVGLALMSLGGFYVLVSSGIDVVGLLTKFGIGESIFQSKLAAGASTFVIAYAVHKVFAPVRIGITLTATPFIVQYLRRVGFLKAPPKAPPKSPPTKST
ncbi:uncharacterized protein LOC117338411 [Pecten maximus]|uniref:uncharacterized protein LOC117338411 n=1 Tax=Pecten maximus TaxID=6579 RepID=UPI0014587B75|nr:uncharacterized protein LOC117338411 [Pecten maximus]